MIINAENSESSVKFIRRMIEDKFNSYSKSYVEYLCFLHKSIQERL
jgi:hypothetical protein